MQDFIKENKKLSYDFNIYISNNIYYFNRYFIRYKDMIIEKHLRRKQRKYFILNLQHEFWKRNLVWKNLFIQFWLIFAWRVVRVIRCILVQFSMPRMADRILSLATWLRNWLLRAAVRGSVNLSVPSRYIVEGSFRARRSYNSLMLSNEPYSRKRGFRFLPFWSGWAHPSFRSRRELCILPFCKREWHPFRPQRTFRLCVAQGILVTARWPNCILRYVNWTFTAILELFWIF